MEMQKPPVPQQQSIDSKWSRAIDKPEKADHLTNGLEPSKRPAVSESSETIGKEEQDDHLGNRFPSRAPQISKLFQRSQKSKSSTGSASSKLSVTQRFVRSIVQKRPGDITDASITNSVRYSNPFGLEPLKEDETSSTLVPIITTQANAAVELAVEGRAIFLPSESQLSQPPALNLAVQGTSMSLPMQNESENEVHAKRQDLHQVDAELRIAEQQHPWFSKRWSFPKPKSQMPDSEASIGKAFNLKSLGAMKCWDIKGPARDMWDRIEPEIRKILAHCDEDLVAQESIPLPMLVGMYMIGKDEQNAAPTILFSCQSRVLRRKAMKFVKRSNLFQTLQGVVLAESSEAPLSMGSDEEQRYSSSVENQQMTDIYIAPPRSMGSLCGIPIFTPNEKGQPFTFTRVATMGGVLQQGDSYYGLTVAHSFLGTEEAQISSEESVEFYFDDSDDSEYSDHLEASTDSSRLPPARRDLMSYSATNLTKLGFTSTLSFNNDLDYALVDIELESFKAPNQISLNINGQVGYKHPQEISQVPTKDCKILAVTGSKGVIKGEMSGVPYIMKMPFGKKFQAVRLVRLESTIEHGDCGSWIVDPENGRLYGAVVSGYPNTEIAYIMPAMAILEDIRLRTGLDTALSQPMDGPIREPSEITYSKSQTLTPLGEIALVREVLNAQPAMKMPSDSELDQPKSASIGLLHHLIERPWSPGSLWELSSKWRDDSALGTSVAGSSVYESHRQLPLKRATPGRNYSFDMTNNSGGWRDDSALGTLLAGHWGYPEDQIYSIEKTNKRIKLGGTFDKPKAKSKASAPISELSTEMPQNLGFLWSIDAIEPVYDEKYPRRALDVGSKLDNDLYKVWLPPNRAKMFKRRHGNLHRWRIGESQLLDDYVRPEKKFAVTSLFFQARQNNFVAVNKDCTRFDVADEVFGWTQIGFAHLPGNLSEVMIGGEYGELAAPADGSSWMPQVLPHVYNYDNSPNRKRPSGGPGGLCGSLSLLIGMAAFSADVNNAEAVVSECFGLNEWKKHEFETGIGRYEGRGVVVSIYLDPEAEGVTANHLKAFESGVYGPIFGATAGLGVMMGYRSDATSKFPQAPKAGFPTTQLLSNPAGFSKLMVSSDQSIPRSFGQYPLGQDPSVTTKQYDIFLSNQGRVDEDETMDEHETA